MYKIYSTSTRLFFNSLNEYFTKLSIFPFSWTALTGKKTRPLRMLFRFFFHSSTSFPISTIKFYSKVTSVWSIWVVIYTLIKKVSAGKGFFREHNFSVYTWWCIHTKHLFIFFFCISKCQSTFHDYTPHRQQTMPLSGIKWFSLTLYHHKLLCICYPAPKNSIFT